jgi:hypothetical protein
LVVGASCVVAFGASTAPIQLQNWHDLPSKLSFA